MHTGRSPLPVNRFLPFARPATDPWSRRRADPTAHLSRYPERLPVTHRRPPSSSGPPGEGIPCDSELNDSASFNAMVTAGAMQKLTAWWSKNATDGSPAPSPGSR